MFEPGVPRGTRAGSGVSPEPWCLANPAEASARVSTPKAWLRLCADRVLGVQHEAGRLVHIVVGRAASGNVAEASCLRGAAPLVYAAGLLPIRLRHHRANGASSSQPGATPQVSDSESTKG